MKVSFKKYIFVIGRELKGQLGFLGKYWFQRICLCIIYSGRTGDDLPLKSKYRGVYLEVYHARSPKENHTYMQCLCAI